MSTYRAPHPAMIKARWHGGSQTPRLVVMHSTVSPCQIGGARAIAHYFATTENKTSAHYAVDPAEVIQCVGDHTVAYHCGYNGNSIGIEMCEFPSRANLARWFTRPHRLMKRRAARLVAELCLAYGIRPYYLGARKLKLWDDGGPTGITTHAAMSAAFKRSTHWDPGSWPRRRFLRRVRREMAAIKEGD